MSRRHIYRSPITSWSLYGALATMAGLLVGYVGLGGDRPWGSSPDTSSGIRPGRRAFGSSSGS